MVMDGLFSRVFAICILHVIIDHYFNVLMKQLRIGECTRVRLRNSCWNLMFYASMFLCCYTAIWRYRSILPRDDRFANTIDLMEIVHQRLLFSYVSLSALFASAAIWHCSRSSPAGVSFVLLTAILIFGYFLRSLELPLSIGLHLSVCELIFETTRCLWIAANKFAIKCENFIFAFSSIVLITYLAITLRLVIVVTKEMSCNFSQSNVFALLTTLYLWFFWEVYNSPLYRFLNHRSIGYRSEGKEMHCILGTIECFLFEPRDDLAYHLRMIKNEIRQREDKLKSMRKNKNGTKMLIQTLKYHRKNPKDLRDLIVSVSLINKKVKERRANRNQKIDQSTTVSEEVDGNQVSDG